MSFGGGGRLVALESEPLPARALGGARESAPRAADALSHPAQLVHRRGVILTIPRPLLLEQVGQ